VPDSVLTILKFCFLALLYLFFVRVLRAVWVEVTGKAPAARPAPAGYGAPAPSGRPARGRAGSMRAAVGGKNGTKLKVIEPAETRGTVYDLTDELTMGRATGCHITLDDTYVSQLHARVFRRDGQILLEDLGSTNGTYVNRTKVTAPLVLRRGDRLQVGKTVMEVT
jgi:hypothetical protein